MLSFFRTQGQPRRASTPSQRRSLRPVVEELEGRDVPASFYDYFDQILARIQAGFANRAECENTLQGLYNAGLQEASSLGFGDTFRSIVDPALRQGMAGCGLFEKATSQTNYGTAPRNRRVPLTASGAKAWKAEAKRLAKKMQSFLPPGHTFAITSIVKAGEHSRYKKMDVAIRGDTTWAELAAAASRAGFWVHAEGVNLNGVDWPLSPKATGAHLDLYLIKKRK